ncbi:MAG TPA: hypothetical protein PLL77_05480 [Pyrinomonadaceae bacterium]|nr:hypothetical protein [Pyrinomonadaceae bacterium]
MKLRIRENTLRFRLGRSEVETFDQTGAIGDNVRFGLGKNDFGYLLEKTPDSNFSASFADGTIVVRVPASDANSWANSDEVSLAGTFLADEQTELRILIEKDFVCLNAHNDEDQSDRYPHPKGDAAC